MTGSSGEVRSVCTTPPGCHCGCGVCLRVSGGRVMEVRGDPDNPYNQGSLCARGYAVTGTLYHPDRVLHPMVRTPGGAWTRVPWDEALDRAAESFLHARDTLGPRSVLFLKGTGRDVGPWLSLLARGFGTPEYYALGPGSGSACLMPRMSVCASVFGGWFVADCSQYFPDRYLHPGWTLPACLLVWGSNPVHSNPDGFLGRWITDCLRRGSRLVVVDPRNTWLAGRADVHLRLRPGTDGALAMAFLRRMHRTGAWDRDFTGMWVTGEDGVWASCQTWDPVTAGRETGIPPVTLVRGADLWLSSSPAALHWGVSVDMSPSALGTAHALASLAILSGNLDRPGGCVTVTDPFGIPRRGTPDLLPGKTGSARYPMTRMGYPYAHADVLLEEMERGRPVACAWVQGTNTVVNGFAGPARAERLLSRIGEVVVCDLFMTPTADRFGTVFLPVACYPERNGLRNWWYQLAAVNRAVEPLGEARSDPEIVLEFGRRTAPAYFPWATAEAWFDHVLTPSGMTWKDLSRKGWVMPGTVYGKHLKGLLRPDGSPGFATPSGRVELQPGVMGEADLLPAPWYVKPPAPEPSYPLVLTTGARTPVFFHSEHRNVPRLRDRNPLPLVEVHPEDARSSGIQDGQWVTLTSPWGSCGRAARITGKVPQGVLMAQHGWVSFRSESPGSDPLNVNRLLPHGLQGRGGLGYPFRCIPCRISPGPALLPDPVALPDPPERPPPRGMEVEGTWCNGCLSCETACMGRLDLERGAAGVKVTELPGGCEAYLPRFTVLCTQCPDTPCAAACPTGALRRVP